MKDGPWVLRTVSATALFFFALWLLKSDKYFGAVSSLLCALESLEPALVTDKDSEDFLS